MPNSAASGAVRAFEIDPPDQFALIGPQEWRQRDKTFAQRLVKRIGPERDLTGPDFGLIGRSPPFATTLLAEMINQGRSQYRVKPGDQPFIGFRPQTVGPHQHIDAEGLQHVFGVSVVVETAHQKTQERLTVPDQGLHDERVV